MLTGDNVRAAARAVYAGDMGAVMPLLDLLVEAGDIRVMRLERMIARLAFAASDLEVDISELQAEMAERGVTGEPQAMPAWRQEQAWMSFRREFRQCFFFELDGRPIRQVLAWIGNVLDTQAVAHRVEAGPTE